MTAIEATERYETMTAGECRDGFYAVQGDTSPISQALADRMPPDTEIASIDVIEAGLRGWPGDEFVAVTMRTICSGEEYHGGCYFAALRN